MTSREGPFPHVTRSCSMAGRRFLEENLEVLIELVQEHPSLYDASRPEHRDEQRTQNIRESIARILGKEGVGGN